jgi:ABC-type multidrug transport system fused ATPase/permease subunit
MYFLWNQLGVSCLTGMAVIILGIPCTSRASLYMKTLQRQLSKIRDERIKLTNEVLSGMKVIKLQAWEKEFQNRILEVRSNELHVFRKYAIAQSIAGVLATSIPLLVSTTTFITYIALGNSLDVATALTSLALFEVLRFPLFMLPQVINNVIEARVSIDRISNFLLQSEYQPIPSYPLKKPGILLENASLVWESAVQKWYVTQQNKYGISLPPSLKPTVFQQMITPLQESLKEGFKNTIAWISCGKIIIFSPSSTTAASGASSVSTVKVLSEEEMNLLIKEALLMDAETLVKELQAELKKYQKYQTLDYYHDSDEAEEGQEGETNERSELISSDYLNSLNNRNINPYATSQTDENRFYKVSFDQFGGSKKGKESSGETKKGEIKKELINDGNSSKSVNDGSALAVVEKVERSLLTLAHVNLFSYEGQLISIIGQVGSGKSSLLNSLLGNLRYANGTIAIKGRIAYASQLPFIQNSTLKDNILYGKPFDEQKYEETLRMCALLPDLAVLPAGDMTEVS